MYRELLIEKFNPDYIDNKGDCFWSNKKGQLHSYRDMPAVVTHTGERQWFKNGVCHRDGDKPAVINPNGTMVWCKEGMAHRDNDKPAIILPSGAKAWFRNGEEYDYKKLNKVYNEQSI